MAMSLKLAPSVAIRHPAIPAGSILPIQPFAFRDREIGLHEPWLLRNRLELKCKPVVRLETADSLAPGVGGEFLLETLE